MVSILLAALNGERFLPAQLDSLCRQTGDFRVLWQDDGSADATRALLEDLSRRDGRFLPGRHQSLHLGAAGNFLSLMTQDDASYTALCDQDDVWRPDRLACCMAAMQDAERRHGADTPLLVHTDCRLTDANGRVLHASFFAHQHWDPAAADLPRLLVQNNVTGCTILMNAALRRLVTAHADPDRLFLHDWFIALTAAAFGRIVFVPDTPVDYRQHGRNVMGASDAGMFRRALRALCAPAKARERIALTYRHARMFREACADVLPPGAARTVDGYLATESLPKGKRLRAIRRGGYVMQGCLTQLGQIIFG